MILLIVLISSVFYLKYFNKRKKKLEEKAINKELDLSKNNSSNYIKNINYTSSDTKGNKYQIKAELAEIDVNEPNIMFLENVVSFIFLKNKNIIKITSDFGKYNSKNYDTIFSKDVIIVYPDHKITGGYLDFSFLNNLGTISTDVVYNNNDTRLLADRIEMDLVTKDTKIFMDDNQRKILVEGKK